jgi:uroporphyrinogen-III synthase
MGEQPPADGPLSGVGVVVTRPAAQAGALAEALEGLGARVLRLPLLAIEPPGDAERARAVLGRLARFDLAVFVSTNAVEHAFALLPPGASIPAGLALAGVGKATAAALRARGLEPRHVPAGRYDSEGLLALEALQAPAVAGRRVLIVRGEGGRELLAETLRSRGAEVEYAEVYRRVQPPLEPAALDGPGRAGAIDAVLLSSGEALDHLLRALPLAAHPWLEHVTLVVPSTRVAEQARRSGHPLPPVVAPEASDRGFVQAVLDWHAAARMAPHAGEELSA